MAHPPDTPPEFNTLTVADSTGPAIRVANAPCSWGVLEFDRGAVSAPYTQVLDEMAASGYDGTELGEWGFMPADAAQLARELALRRLELVAGFVPVPLADRAWHDTGVATAVRVARLLHAAGGNSAVLVLSDDNARVPERAAHAGRITPQHGLMEAGWRSFAEGAEAVARAVRETTGLRTAFHPHCGGFVETPDEIDQLMRRTDPDLVGLCVDTGHITYGGGDPVQVLERYGSRVLHVHLKDCDPEVAAASRAERLDYCTAVRRRLFCELGTGQVDFARVTETLAAQQYRGWLVVEQDVFAGCGTPLASATRSREYLRRLGL